MKLDISRFLSDRLVFDCSRPEKLRITNSFWDWCKRIISWIWSPKSYSDENKRTIACFKKYLIDTLGTERLQRICNRYSLNFDAMEKKGNPLLSRHVAMIVTGARDVSVEDINEFMQEFIRNTEKAGIQDPWFQGKKSFLELDSETLADLQHGLSSPFKNQWEVPKISKEIGGGATNWFARIFYDPFLADRERLQLCGEHAKDDFETFMHNMCARVIKREMNVGALVPAPNHPDGRAQFYYVSAKIVTGEGMVSYLFHPATKDTHLEPLRLFRGTAARNSEIDGISTLITDLEEDLGRTAYESGQLYEKKIAEELTVPTIEGGHSLGSTIVQYRLADMDHIRKAYLFCGPGLPEREVEKFNLKEDPPELVIRHPFNDKWSSMGQVHIGYKSRFPGKVDYQIYHFPRKFKDSVHTTVCGKRKMLYYGREGGIPPEKRDKDFYHKDHFREKLRMTFGPPVASVLRGIRDWSRSHFPTRAEEERGLKIGNLHKGRWRVDHYRVV